MSFIKEFWEFLKIRKKYWLLPIIIVLVLFGGLIILSQGSAVAPFIYTEGYESNSEVDRWTTAHFFETHYMGNRTGDRAASAPINVI